MLEQGRVCQNREWDGCQRGCAITCSELVFERGQEFAADRVPRGTVAVGPGRGPLHLQTTLAPLFGLGPSLMSQLLAPQGLALVFEPE
jgi:hypothetical protein